MANQYSGSLEHLVSQKFECSARELLEQFSDEGLSYAEVQEKVGVTNGTIRKWARRFGVILQSDDPIEKKRDDIWEYFSEPKINAHNFLSRTWRSRSQEEQMGAA